VNVPKQPTKPNIGFSSTTGNKYTSSGTSSYNIRQAPSSSRDYTSSSNTYGLGMKTNESSNTFSSTNYNFNLNNSRPAIVNVSSSSQNSSSDSSIRSETIALLRLKIIVILNTLDRVALRELIDTRVDVIFDQITVDFSDTLGILNFLKNLDPFSTRHHPNLLKALNEYFIFCHQKYILKCSIN
jgi:hypothetical protein